MFEKFDEFNFTLLCDKLAKKDRELRNIIKQHGYPPMWTRPATFQTLILFILEQQVSLASAYAAFKKLKERIGNVTPSKILSLTDEELRSCYFSRQKIIYARELAIAVQSKQLRLKKFSDAHEDEIRLELKKIKGIGDWTVDVYLLFALQRSDVFPVGDVSRKTNEFAIQTAKGTEAVIRFESRGDLHLSKFPVSSKLKVPTPSGNLVVRYTEDS